MKTKLLTLVLGWMAFSASRLEAITYGPFGPHGEGGAKNGQSFLIGPGGSVHELDAFLYVQGVDLNGSRPGTAAQLSRDALPAGLSCSFTPVLSPNQQDVVLTYSFTNTTVTNFSDLRFFVFLDAEIDEATNTFFNEYGAAQGVLGRGAGDAAPDRWQIDEPGFQGGSIMPNLLLGTLSNSNAIPQTAPNDVALALGFWLGTLKPSQSTTVQVMISEATNSLGGFALVQHDSDPASTTTISLSGSATVNELPVENVSDLVQFNFIKWSLNRGTGTLLGTLSVSNSAASTVSLGAPFQVGLPSSSSFYLPHPGGQLADGVPCLDLTDAFTARLANGLLTPGQTVIVTNAVELYSLTRSPPANTLFEFWATPQ